MFPKLFSMKLQLTKRPQKQERKATDLEKLNLNIFSICAGIDLILKHFYFDK